MVSIRELKDRLTVLPERRIQAELGAVFASHLKNTVDARQKVERALSCAKHAQTVLPSTRYTGAASNALKAVQQAARLHEKLNAASDSIREDSVNRIFITINDCANSASKMLADAWTREVDEKVRDWAQLGDVLSRLSAAHGKRLRSAVTALQAAKNSPPENKAGAVQIRQRLEELNEIVGSLGLKDDFGRFLKAATTQQGADLKAVLSTKVQEKINDLNLWDFFRVKLPT